MATQVSTEGNRKMFRCADVGYTDCGWSLEGHSSEEMIPIIEDHARQVHHLELKEEAVQHVREAIRAVADDGSPRRAITGRERDLMSLPL